jgi:hypothetical protein
MTWCCRQRLFLIVAKVSMVMTPVVISPSQPTRHNGLRERTPKVQEAGKRVMPMTTRIVDRRSWCTPIDLVLRTETVHLRRRGTHTSNSCAPDTALKANTRPDRLPTRTWGTTGYETMRNAGVLRRREGVSGRWRCYHQMGNDKRKRRRRTPALTGSQQGPEERPHRASDRVRRWRFEKMGQGV